MKKGNTRYFIFIISLLSLGIINCEKKSYIVKFENTTTPEHKLDCKISWDRYEDPPLEFYLLMGHSFILNGAEEDYYDWKLYCKGEEDSSYEYWNSGGISVHEDLRMIIYWDENSDCWQYDWEK